MRTKEKSLREIQHHLENTAWILVKIYNKKQLSIMDGIRVTQIEKHPEKYLPVRIDKRDQHFKFYNEWYAANKPYWIGYIRMDEVRGLYRKKTWKNLIAY